MPESFHPSQRLWEVRRQRLPGVSGLDPPSAGEPATAAFTPGTTGVQDGAASLARLGQTQLEPLEVQMDLDEFIEMNQVQMDAKSRLIRKGPVDDTDPNRPALILETVKRLFSPLIQQKLLTIRLGNGHKAGRFVKGAYMWEPESDRLCGASAVGRTRTRMDPFRPMAGDEHLPITGYIFEGPIRIVCEYPYPNNLEGRALANLIGALIAHELAHQFGEGHVQSPDDIMFVFAEKDAKETLHWTDNAVKSKLAFTPDQLGRMRTLLTTP